jgi:hypothetical protein
VSSDQSEPRLVNPGPLATEESQLPDRRVDRILIHELLHTMQNLRSIRQIGLGNLTVEQFIDVGIAAIDIATALDYEGLHPHGGIAERSAASLDYVAELPLGISFEEGCPFERSQFGANADLSQIVQRGLSHIGVGRVAVVVAGVKPIRISCLRQQPAPPSSDRMGSWEAPSRT